MAGREVRDRLGKPYRTQEVLHRALTALYPDAAGGFPGNDDLGTMSAWYVLSAVGIYPEIPGTGVLALATPVFRDVTLHLAAGAVHLHAPQAGPRAPYIRGMRQSGMGRAPRRSTALVFADRHQRLQVTRAGLLELILNRGSNAAAGAQVLRSPDDDESRRAGLT